MAEKKRFTNFSTLTRTFTDGKGAQQTRPFVVIEGNLTRDIELKAGKNTPYVFASIGTSISAEEVFARSTGTFSNSDSYSESPFFNLKFFGKAAERVAKIGAKGLKLVVWGDLEEESYKDSAGNVKKSVTITVENFIVVFSNGVSDAGGEATPASAQTPAKPAPAQPQASTPDPADALIEEEEEEDDLPF